MTGDTLFDLPDDRPSAYGDVRLPPRLDAPIPSRARAEQPETSANAAGLSLGRRGSQRVRLAEAHAAHPGGLTDEEAATIAGIDPRSTPWRRCGELRDLGVLADTGRRRPTSLGADAVVWALTDLGRAAVAAIPD